jgi:hypothetical protein
MKQEERMDEEPRLSKEIASVAIYTGKIIGGVVAAVAVATGIIVGCGPIGGQIVVYTLLICGLVVWTGFQNYKRKQESLKYREELRRENARREQEWAEVKARAKKNT